MAAHLIGTESMLQGVATSEADVDVSTLKHVRNDIGVMNERWVRRLRGLQRRRLARHFRAITANRREALNGMPDATGTRSPQRRRPGHLRTVHAGRTSTAGCTFTTSATRMRHPAGDSGLGGPASRLALDEIAASMGFVVGKLGGAPDGSRVASS